ncbi:hypothetical protein [Stenotrophomonas phage RAS14]
MSNDYPLFLNFKSDEFIEVQKKLENILEEVTAELKRTTVFASSDTAETLTSNQTLQVTFTFDYENEYFYLGALANPEDWYYDNSVPQPRFVMSDFVFSRHGLTLNEDISTIITYIFKTNASIKNKYRKLLADAVVEYRNNRAKELKSSFDILLSSPTYGW